MSSLMCFCVCCSVVMLEWCSRASFPSHGWAWTGRMTSWQWEIAMETSPPSTRSPCVRYSNPTPHFIVTNTVWWCMQDCDFVLFITWLPARAHLSSLTPKIYPHTMHACLCCGPVYLVVWAVEHSSPVSRLPCDWTRLCTTQCPGRER